MDALTHIDVAAAPLLWFGGVVSNLQALRALRSEAERLGIPAQRVFGTGDAIAYAGSPAEVLDELRDWGVMQIQGNCEAAIIAAADDCGCGFDSGSTCDVLTVNWYRHCLASVREDQRAWLAQWPEQLLVHWHGRRIRVVHGAPQHINQFVFPSHDAQQLQTMIGDVDAVVGGHSGLPWSRIIAGKLWHNGGSIGMPAHDGTPRTWFSVWTPQADGRVAIEHKALHYDVAEAIAAMQAAQLTQGYERALRTGLWPSDDVLPPAERLNGGTAITAQSMTWL